MKTTGIVRRLDDLGRIVIPREIRKVLNIQENHPLEIFYDENGIYLKKYINESDWEMAQKIVTPILGDCFALLDQYGDVRRYYGAEYKKNYGEAAKDSYLKVIEIKSKDFQPMLQGYLVVKSDFDDERANMAKGVLYNFFSSNF